MKRSQLFWISLLVPGLMSFVLSTGPGEKVLLTGSYGTCGYNDAPSANQIVSLTLNDDASFHYYNGSNPKKLIDIKGTWTMKNNTIVLKGYDPALSIHDKWTIDKNDKCLKSRHGMNFMRLCHLASCN